MKKILAGFITAAIVIGSTVGLVACNKPGGAGNQSTFTPTSAKNLFGMAMMSADAYVEPSSGATTQATDAEIELVKDIDSKIDLILGYMKTNAPESTITDVTDADLDVKLQNLNLDKKMSFTKANLLGESDTFDFYYNEFKVQDDKEVPDDEDDNDIELEESFKLKGKVVINNNFDEILDMEGVRKNQTETETEDGVTETESESKFKATINYPNGNQMTFVQKLEMEDGEKEEKFEYTITDKDGHQIDSFEVEIEEEQGESEIYYRDKKVEIEVEQEFAGLDQEIELYYKDLTTNNAPINAKVIISKDNDGNEVKTYKINNQKIEIK